MAHYTFTYTDDSLTCIGPFRSPAEAVEAFKDREDPRWFVVELDDKMLNTSGKRLMIRVVTPSASEDWVAHHRAKAEAELAPNSASEDWPGIRFEDEFVTPPENQPSVETLARLLELSRVAFDRGLRGELANPFVKPRTMAHLVNRAVTIRVARKKSWRKWNRKLAKLAGKSKR